MIGFSKLPRNATMTSETENSDAKENQRDQFSFAGLVWQSGSDRPERVVSWAVHELWHHTGSLFATKLFPC